MNKNEKTLRDVLSGKKDSKYERIIYWSKPDDCFLVEVPEPKGRLMYA